MMVAAILTSTQAQAEPFQSRDEYFTEKRKIAESDKQSNAVDQYALLELIAKWCQDDYTVVDLKQAAKLALDVGIYISDPSVRTFIDRTKESLDLQRVITHPLMPPQPARQPKAVASGLIGDDDALDLPTRLGRFVAPTLHKLQQLVLVGRKLLQWLALDAWDQPRDKPARLAHFDDGDQRAILVESGKGPAQIIRLRHGALHRIARQRRRWHALAARPIPSPLAPQLRRPPYVEPIELTNEMGPPMTMLLPSGILLALAVAGSIFSSGAAQAQDASTAPTTSTFVTTPVLPGIANNLSIIEQELDAAGQLELNAFSAESGLVSTNISRLSPATSGSTGTSSSGSGASGSSAR